jgi:hypothetical protein
MKKVNVIVLYLLVFFTIPSCQGDDAIVDTNPANLVVNIVVSDDRSGTINLTATAENTIEYTFYPGDNSSDDPVVSSDGLFEYTYATTGIYSLEVRAYNAAGKFVKIIQQKNIIVGDDELPTNTEEGYLTPLTYEGMNLIWQDEFNGSSLNGSEWNFETGTGNSGWGNNELQFYRRENTTVSDGFLTIEAKKESFSGQSYTSSRLTTQNKFSFQYGRVDIRAILPQGQGIWPAFWMLGDKISSVGWPKCGETDIMEMVGGGAGRDDTVYGTLHWDNNGDYACTCDQGNEYELSTGVYADEFHVFTMTWDANTIQWFVDDVPFKTTDITPADLSEFHDKFFLIFNLAVGGNWPGSPNGATIFPQQLIVDYVRVFQNQ